MPGEFPRSLVCREQRKFCGKKVEDTVRMIMEGGQIMGPIGH